MRNRSWLARTCSSACFLSVMSWQTPITRTGLPDSSRCRDVACHRDDVRDAAVRIEHGTAMARDPADLSAREEKPKLHVPVLAVVDGVEERLLGLFPVLGMHFLKRIGTDEPLVVSEQAAVGGV